MSLRDDNEVLMSVQFPDVFVVAGSFKVEVRDETKVGKAGYFVIDVVAPPLDFGTGRNRGAEDREAMSEYLPGECKDLVRRNRGDRWQGQVNALSPRGSRRRECQNGQIRKLLLKAKG
jgi:hypothetical protein